MKTKTLIDFDFKNTLHTQWLVNYLLVSHILSERDTLILWKEQQINAEQLSSLSQHLNLNAEGREKWKKLAGAWNRKKRRSRNNGKKYMTFELSKDAQVQLKYLATEVTQEAALEMLILGHYKIEQDLRHKKLWDDKCTLEQIEIAKLKTTINRLEKECIKYQENSKADLAGFPNV